MGTLRRLVHNIATLQFLKPFEDALQIRYHCLVPMQGARASRGAGQLE